jgi:hypothetical protein
MARVPKTTCAVTASVWGDAGVCEYNTAFSTVSASRHMQKKFFFLQMPRYVPLHAWRAVLYICWPDARRVFATGGPDFDTSNNHQRHKALSTRCCIWAKNIGISDDCIFDDTESQKIRSWVQCCAKGKCKCCLRCSTGGVTRK